MFVTHDLEEAIALADKVVVLTAGPGGTVKASFEIDLPRPRVVQEIRFERRFVDLYHQIWDALRSEVDVAYAQTTAASRKAACLMTVVTELTAAGERHEVSAKEKSYRPNCAAAESSFTCARSRFLVVILGGWQLYVGNDSRKFILYGVPSGIVGRLAHLDRRGNRDRLAGRPDLGHPGRGADRLPHRHRARHRRRDRARTDPFLADVFSPYIKVLNSIPRIVLGSVFILAFGLGIESKVLLVIVLVFFGVFFNAFQGVREVDRNLVANATSLAAPAGRSPARSCSRRRSPGSSPACTSASASRSSARSSASSSAAHRASAC